jgi:NNP family nitrate/nitrite transporter-like MFS transporter
VFSKRLHGLIRDFFPFPLLPLFLLVGIFYVNFICRVAIAPLLPVIKLDLGLGLTKASSLFLLMASGYCIGLFMSGFVTARLSYRLTILLSAGMMGIAMLSLSQTASLGGIYLSLMTAGLAAGLYLPSGIAIITDLVSKEHWGKALAIHELAPNLGFVTAPLLVEAFLRLCSWRSILALMGSCSILIGLIFLFYGRGGDSKGEAPRLRAMRSLFGQPIFWMMTALFSGAIGASFGAYSMMPLFLVSERGMSRELANTLLGLARGIGFLTLFLSGWITDRAGHKQVIVFLMTITGVLVLLVGVIQHPSLVPWLVILQASSAVCTFPAGFALMSARLSPSLRNLGVSLIIMIGYFLGAGLCPLGMGYVAELFSFSWSFILLGLFCLSMVPLLLKIRPLQGDNQ